MGNVLGTAEADITPPVGTALAAYQRTGPSSAVLDPLCAVSFYISDGDDSVSITSIDLVAIAPEICDRVRTAVAAGLGISRDAVLLHVTHTHSSPWGLERPGDQDHAEYLRGLERTLIEVAVRAAVEPTPCLVSWGVVEADIGENRREVRDGQAVMGRNPDGPVDRRVGTLRFRHPESGESLGVLVTATAHANVLKADSTVLSADFPGWTRTLLEDSLRCPVLFVQGAAGDVNATHRGRVADLRRMAWATAGAALSSLAGHRHASDTAPVGGLARTVQLQCIDVPSPEEARAMATHAAEAWHADTSAWLAFVTRLRDRGGNATGLSFDVAVLRVGDWLMGGVPMEAFSQTALNAADRIGSPTAFLRGYTNGYRGYLPTTDQLALGGYEAMWSTVVYGLQTGLVLPLRPGSAELVEGTFVDLGARLLAPGDHPGHTLGHGAQVVIASGAGQDDGRRPDAGQ